MKDVWIACMNRDKVFRQWMASPPAKQDEDSKGDQKAIALSLLSQHDFNIRGITGEVIAETPGAGCKFDSFWDTRKAYKRAFKNEGMFRPEVACHDMIVLQAARNVILHAGTIDASYLRKLGSGKANKTSFPELLNLPLKSKFPVTGKFVGGQAKSAMELCMNLLEEVNTRVRDLEKTVP